MFQDELQYYTADGKTQKGCISVAQMRGCHALDQNAFTRPYMFQVVYLTRSAKTRVLYIQGASYADTKAWSGELRRLISAAVVDDAATHFHRGAFLKRAWTCCKNRDKYAAGCITAKETDRDTDSTETQDCQNQHTKLKAFWQHLAEED